MTSLTFEVIDARPEPHAAVPTIMLRGRVSESTGGRVHALVLRVQIRIEPQRRRYAPEEEDRLYELFGAPAQWADSLRPFLWTHVTTTIGGFTGSTEFDLPVPCTYDFEVAGAKYLHALEGGEIPLILLFSGTAFTQAAPVSGVGMWAPGVAGAGLPGAGAGGFVAEPIAWNLEAAYRMLVSVWRGVMDLYFPNSGWVRVSRDTLDRLQHFKAAQAVPTWDQAFELLLKRAGEDDP
jgi:hypothetical protein